MPGRADDAAGSTITRGNDGAAGARLGATGPTRTDVADAAVEAAPAGPPWWRTGRARRIASTVGLGVLIAALSWSAEPRPPLVVLSADESWIAALSLARSQGFAFGRDVVFNYGPLGYLVNPSALVTDDPTRLMLVVRAVILVSLCTAIVAGFRRLGLRLGWAALAATAVALPVATALEPAPQITVVVTVAVTALLCRPPGPRGQAVAAVVLPVVGSFALLAKASEGMATAAIAGVGVVLLAVVSGRGWRGALTNAAIAAASFVVALSAWWSAAGQPFDALAGFARGSWEVSIGFAGAMGAESNPRWEYLCAAAAVAVLAAYTAWATRERPLRDRACIAAVLVVAVAFFFKAGFVRHDNHSQEFFGALVVLPLGLAARRDRTWGLLAIGSLLAVLALVLRPAGWAPLLVTEHLQHGGKAALWAVSSEAAHSEDERFRLASDVPQAMLDRIAGGSVHVEPVSAGLSWIYRDSAQAFDWRPAPTIQSYNNYTPYLDELAAAFLRGDRAPQWILWRSSSVDGRIQRFDGPAYQLELLCRYRAVDAANHWVLLERRPASACGAPREGPTVTGTAGSRLEVPTAGPDDIVVGSFAGDGVSGASALRSFLWKPPVVQVEVGDAVGRRWVPGTAGQPHLLRMPDCLAADRPGALDEMDTRDYPYLVFSGVPADAPVTMRTEVIPYDCGA